MELKTRLYHKNLQLNALEEKKVLQSSLLLWAVYCVFLILIVWAYFAEIDEISRGLGQVVPSSRVQIIQNLEGGILSEILVSEGDTVDKETILARLENTHAQSLYQDNLAKIYENLASIARLEARINNSKPDYPEELLENQNLIERSNSLLEAEIRQDMAEIDVLESQKQVKEQEILEQEELKKQLEKSLQLAEKQRDLAKPLLQSRAYAQIDFVNLEQSVQNFSSQLSVLEFTLPKLYTGLEEVENKLIAYTAEKETNLRKEINLLEAELSSLRESLRSGSDRLTRTDVRSPVNGIVKSIYINTLGGVVRPAEPIMEIVPLDDDLVVEAKINPTDIAFIYAGEPALVKLTAYDFSIYGAIEGVVEHISADTLEDKNGNIFYAVKIRTKETKQKEGQEKLPILPGMQAQVDIITGKKSILDYILKPILKSTQNALSER